MLSLSLTCVYNGISPDRTASCTNAAVGSYARCVMSLLAPYICVTLLHDVTIKKCPDLWFGVNEETLSLPSQPKSRTLML